MLPHVVPFATLHSLHSLCEQFVDVMRRGCAICDQTRGLEREGESMWGVGRERKRERERDIAREGGVLFACD